MSKPTKEKAAEEVDVRVRILADSIQKGSMIVAKGKTITMTEPQAKALGNQVKIIGV